MKIFIQNWLNRTLTLCVLFFMAFRVSANAQPFSVSGTVTASNVPVKNASVAFIDYLDATKQYTALTDGSGKYQIDFQTAVDSDKKNPPTKFDLEQNYPNPFSSSTSIPYRLGRPSDVRIAIYDVLGRVVRKFTIGEQAMGAHSIQWDGANDFGQKMATGVYFYRLEANGRAQVRKTFLNSGARIASGFSSHASTEWPSPVHSALNKPAMEAAFQVRIANTGSTSPLIIPKTIDDVIVQKNTILDITVDPQNPILSTAVNPDSALQIIRGFGGANILRWRPDMTADQVNKAFGIGPGKIGFSILRLRVPYTSDGDEFGYQVPTAKLAQSLGAIVFATPWTPPPSMKSNNNIVGGSLDENYYEDYADYLKSFADYMSDHGAPLYAISIQNEPDANVTYESCDWNGGQFLNFVKDYAPSIGTRIMMPESQNFQRSLSDPTLNDSTAASHVDIIGGHLYGGGLASYPLATRKGKELWMTEYLDLDTTWTAVLGTGKQMSDCMNVGMNAYVWWYIVRFYGPINESGVVTKRGYVMSQFARFIRPGYHRVYCSQYSQRNVYMTSYASDSGKIVIVMVNTNATSADQTVILPNGNMTAFTSYATTQFKNCEQSGDIQFTNGSFTVTLEPSSITTFVSN